MTPTQLTTFRAFVQTDSNVAAARTAGDHGAIAAYYNTPASSGTIWRPNILCSELNTAIVWSEFAALTVALQNTYMALISVPIIDATKSNIRGGFTTVFGAGTTSRTNLTNLAQRTPTNFEVIFTVSQVCSAYGTIVAPDEIGV